MKKTLLALAALTVCAASMAQSKPEPEYTLSYNLGAVTDYRYRGISQTAKNPALQGGIDFAHKSGVYLGTWASTISWIKDSTNPSTTKGPLEVDIYGGYKTEVGKGFTVDVGGLQYWYVNNNLKTLSANANTFELYGALSYAMFTAKYSYATTNLFGAAVPGTGSKGSTYFDLSANFDLGNGFTLTPHIGVQTIKNLKTIAALPADNYTDYSLTLAKDFDGLVLSAALVGTNWKSKMGANYTLPGSGTKNLAGSTLVLGLKKNF